MKNEDRINVARELIDNRIQDIQNDMDNLSNKEIGVALKYLLDEYIKDDLVKQYQQIEDSIANITEIMSETETGRGLVQKTWGFEFHIDDLYRQANESKSRTEEE